MNLRTISFCGLVSVIFIGSVGSSALNRAVIPTQAEFNCLTEDGYFRLELYPRLSLIRVFDITQNRLSFSREGFQIIELNKHIRVVNDRALPQNEDLPEGVVLDANLRKSGVNGFVINDNSGSVTLLACTSN